MIKASLDAEEEDEEEEALPADETLEQVPLKMLDASVEVRDPLDVDVVVSK